MKYLIAALTVVVTATNAGGQLAVDLKNPAAQTIQTGGFGMEQPCNYDRCALRMTTGLMTWRIVRGAEGASVGNLGMFTAPDLEPDFSKVPDAAAEIRPFRQGYSRSGMFMGAGAAVVFGGIAAAGLQGNKWAPLAVSLAGLPVLWYGSWLRGKSIEVLSKSIWLYNRSLPR